MKITHKEKEYEIVEDFKLMKTRDFFKFQEQQSKYIKGEITENDFNVEYLSIMTGETQDYIKDLPMGEFQELYAMVNSVILKQTTDESK